MIATIPGVGPKTAQKLYLALKPKDISDLEKKLTQLLRRIKKSGDQKGFGEKTVANILRGIQTKVGLGSRLIVTDALSIAEHFLAMVRTAPGVTQVDPVGSLRRMRETVGDIDIIAVATDPKPVIEAFLKTEGVSEVLAQGATKAMVMYGNQAHVDIEVLPEREYGSLLQHFTGSKEHNIAMRSLADDLGLSFSEHGFKVTEPSHPWEKKQIDLAKKAKRWDAGRAMILCPRRRCLCDDWVRLDSTATPGK